MARTRWLAPCLLLLACSGGVGSGGESGESGAAPVPGRGAEGWLEAFADVGVAFSCDAEEGALIAAAVPVVEVEGVRLYVGYEQVGDNQNPLIARYDHGVQVYCRRHETQGPDGRALGLTWDGGDAAYLVYTVVGGGTELEGKGGWLPSYAPGALHGGGAKVGAVGRVSVSDGTLDRASFVLAVKSDGGVNSHSPADAPTVLENGDLEFLGESAHKPIDPAGNVSMDCTDYPFDTRYVFSPDLGELRCASSSNCVSTRECG